MPQSVWEQALNAAAAVVRGLSLDGLPESQVYLQLRPNPKVMMFPAVVVCPGEREPERDERAFDTERDQAAYPCLVEVHDRADPDYSATLGQHLLWREQLVAAFRSQNLADVAGCWDLEVQPHPAVDWRRPEYQHYVSGFTVLCKCTVPRS